METLKGRRPFTSSAPDGNIASQLAGWPTQEPMTMSQF
jgi:hypothetical protein